MPLTVEANLRIPSFTLRADGERGARVDNTSVRFIKRIVVDSMPKVGDLLELSAQSGLAFQASVTRVDWDDRKDLFVVSCAYAARSITAVEYDALREDPDWQLNQLP